MRATARNIGVGPQAKISSGFARLLELIGNEPSRASCCRRQSSRSARNPRRRSVARRRATPPFALHSTNAPPRLRAISARAQRSTDAMPTPPATIATSRRSGRTVETIAERADDVESIAASKFAELARALARYKEEKACELAFCFIDGERSCCTLRVRRNRHNVLTWTCPACERRCVERERDHARCEHAAFDHRSGVHRRVSVERRHLFSHFQQILTKISEIGFTPLLQKPLYCIESVNNQRKEGPQMAGLIVFKSLADALRAGYQVYDRTADGYLVRTRTAAGWAMALVSCK